MASLSSTIARQLQLFAPLRYREFRLFWIGLVAQVAGRQMMMVTVGWLTFDLTHSPLVLGFVNLFTALPQLTLSLLGGALADRLDRRLLIAISQSISALVIVTLGVLTATGLIEVWHLFVAAVLIGLVHAFDEPSRQSLFPNLLPDRSKLPEAVPLLSMAWQLNRIVAPSIAGFVIAFAGAGISFFISAAGAAMMAAVMRLLHVPRVSRSGSGNMLGMIAQGLGYVRGHAVFRVVIGLAFFNSLFALGYTLMMPVFAVDVFDVGPAGLGVMYSFTGLGGVAGLLTVSRLVRAFGPGRVILASLGTFAGALIVFALSTSFLPALGILVVIGYTSHIYLTGGEIVLQTLVPDQLRGRVMGLYGMLWTVMPLGAFGLNAVANFTGAPYALAGGAGIVLLGVLLVAARAPALIRVRLDQAPETAEPPASV